MRPVSFRFRNYISELPAYSRNLYLIGITAIIVVLVVTSLSYQRRSTVAIFDMPRRANTAGQPPQVSLSSKSGCRINDMLPYDTLNDTHSTGDATNAFISQSYECVVSIYCKVQCRRGAITGREARFAATGIRPNRSESTLMFGQWLYGGTICYHSQRTRRLSLGLYEA